MTERLRFIASLIENGRGVADIGTDHGYIPAALALGGYTGRIIAADINAGPLQCAEKTAAETGVSEKIEFLLCDGLSKVEPSAVDTIVIAGMGGDTITGILDRDYWCASPGYKLVLQPMSHQNVLRYWLINNEFTITRELLAMDSGKMYQIFTAQYGPSPRYSDAELFTGSYDQICSDRLFGDYLNGLIEKFTRAVNGMETASCDENIPLALNRGVLKELLDMKERKNG